MAPYTLKSFEDITTVEPFLWKHLLVLYRYECVDKISLFIVRRF